jgi:hypothetical protein
MRRRMRRKNKKNHNTLIIIIKRIFYANGRSPPINRVIFGCRKQGCAGMNVGTGSTYLKNFLIEWMAKVYYLIKYFYLI